jgi:hypothetical protein
MGPMSDSALTFVAPPQEAPGLEIRVNFGVFAGREATNAEIDELARWLLSEVGDVTIVSEQRHEFSEDVEATLHQVRVEVDGERLPDDLDALAELTERLVERCDHWARTAINARHVDV